VKSVAMENSIVIKNALESDDSDSFYVPDDNEIEPNALKSILTFIHSSKIMKCDIEMKDEKHIQHMLLICNWFGFTHLYARLIENYKTLLTKSERTLNMFTQISNIYEFLNIEQEKSVNHNLNDSLISCDISYDKTLLISNAIQYHNVVINNKERYNPICGLITGDKLNDTKLIDFSLSLFDFDPLYLGVYKLFGEICDLLMKHMMRKTTKTKICMKLIELDEIFKRSPQKVPRFTFSENYVREKIDWYALSKTPNSIELLDKHNSGEIDWYALSRTPNSIELLNKYG